MKFLEFRFSLAFLLGMALLGCSRQPEFFVPVLWFSLLNGALLWAGWRVAGCLLPDAVPVQRAVAAALGGIAWIVAGSWML